MNTQEIMKEIDSLIRETKNKYISEAVLSGKKVMGYYCTYVPEELMTAANVIPYRVRGMAGKDTALADAYLSARLCTFIRSSLALALDGSYDFLEGVVLTQACDHVRRGADLWEKKVKRPFYSFLSVPRTPKEWVFGWYLEELLRLKGELEKHLGMDITDEKLKNAIILHNDIRKRLTLIGEMRKSVYPPLSGKEMLSLSIASVVLPRKEFLTILDQLIPALTQEKTKKKYRARLILAGGELDEPDYLNTIEEVGGVIVGEELCFGERQAKDLVEETENPLEAIARRYFFKVPCARMVGGFPDRLESIVSKVKERNADGVIFQRIKFCDPWAAEAHNLRHRLRERGIPALFLEREYGVLAVGQVKTRVQGFLEQLGK